MKAIDELIYSKSDRKTRSRIETLVATKKIRHIGPRLYTSAPQSRVAEIVRANWSKIVDELYPGAVLSHKTAFEFRPDTEGRVILTGHETSQNNFHGNMPFQL